MTAYKSLLFTGDFRQGMLEVVTQYNPSYDENHLGQVLITWSFWNLFHSRNVKETKLIKTQKNIPRQMKNVHFKKVEQVMKEWKGDTI